MPITNEDLQKDFGGWCETYAYKNDSELRPSFKLKYDQGIYSLNTWIHTSPKPTLSDLLALNLEDKKSYDNLFSINEFLSQANPILKAGYLLLWTRLRTAEGADAGMLADPTQVLEDLRQSLLTELNTN